MTNAKVRNPHSGSSVRAAPSPVVHHRQSRSGRWTAAGGRLSRCSSLPRATILAPPGRSAGGAATAAASQHHRSAAAYDIAACIPSLAAVVLEKPPPPPPPPEEEEEEEDPQQQPRGEGASAPHACRRFERFCPRPAVLDPTETELARRAWCDAGNSPETPIASPGALRALLGQLNIPVARLLNPYLAELVARQPNQQMYLPQLLALLAQCKTLHALRLHRAKFNAKREWLRAALIDCRRLCGPPQGEGDPSQTLERRRTGGMGVTGAAVAPPSSSSCAPPLLQPAAREELHEAFLSLVEMDAAAAAAAAAPGGSVVPSPSTTATRLSVRAALDWIVRMQLQPGEELRHRAPPAPALAASSAAAGGMVHGRGTSDGAAGRSTDSLEVASASGVHAPFIDPRAPAALLSFADENDAATPLPATTTSAAAPLTPPPPPPEEDPTLTFSEFVALVLSPQLPASHAAPGPGRASSSSSAAEAALRRKLTSLGLLLDGGSRGSASAGSSAAAALAHKDALSSLNLQSAVGLEDEEDDDQDEEDERGVGGSCSVGLADSAVQDIIRQQQRRQLRQQQEGGGGGVDHYAAITSRRRSSRGPAAAAAAAAAAARRASNGGGGGGGAGAAVAVVGPGGHVYFPGLATPTERAGRFSTQRALTPAPTRRASKRPPPLPSPSPSPARPTRSRADVAPPALTSTSVSAAARVGTLAKANGAAVVAEAQALLQRLQPLLLSPLDRTGAAAHSNRALSLGGTARASGANTPFAASRRSSALVRSLRDAASEMAMSGRVSAPVAGKGGEAHD